MKNFTVAASLTLLLSIGTALCCAQDVPQLPQPQKEHQWLERFVGEWVSETEAKMGPDQPVMKCEGTQRANMLGGFWMIAEGHAVMMGMPIHSRLTLGFDPAQDKYVGSWIDSSNNYMWTYEGSLSDDGNTLTLNSEGPNFLVPGQTSNYREVLEFKDDGHYVFTSSVETEGGKWFTFMTAHFHRKQPASAE
jgi:hypothetical protein